MIEKHFFFYIFVPRTILYKYNFFAISETRYIVDSLL